MKPNACYATRTSRKVFLETFREEPKFRRFESWADPVFDLSISLFDEDGGGNIDFGLQMLQKCNVI